MDLDVTKWGLGPRMNTASVPNNPWMHFILIDAQTTLRFAAPGLPIDLAITEDIRVQAAAVFDPPTILVAGGLADMLCKFAAQLVTAGVFVAFRSAKPDWHPEKSVEVATVRRHLEADRFVWIPRTCRGSPTRSVCNSSCSSSPRWPASSSSTNWGTSTSGTVAPKGSSLQ